MKLDICFCDALVRGKSEFDFNASRWNISGSNEEENLKISSSDFKFDPDQGFSSMIFKDQTLKIGVSGIFEGFYSFKDSYRIENDSIYKSLSTIAFDWNYKLLAYVLMKISINSRNKYMNQLKEGKNSDLLIYNKLIKLMELIESSPLNVTQ